MDHCRPSMRPFLLALQPHPGEVFRSAILENAAGAPKSELLPGRHPARSFCGQSPGWTGGQFPRVLPQLRGLRFCIGRDRRQRRGGDFVLGGFGGLPGRPQKAPAHVFSDLPRTGLDGETAAARSAFRGRAGSGGSLVGEGARRSARGCRAAESAGGLVRRVFVHGPVASEAKLPVSSPSFPDSLRESDRRQRAKRRRANRLNTRRKGCVSVCVYVCAQ
mmetsp:Transcript_39731/g.89120  ORF Transcript_39731/g.89120 Transcript_39731/m.89120 type:complete len:219 (-) Transcript_39731:28-684(-)